jgi:hypothetical protein
VRISEAREAIIRVRGVRDVPADIRVELQAPCPDRRSQPATGDLPRNVIKPKSVRIVGDAAELTFDPTSPECRSFAPGAPVLVTIPELGIRHEFRWPRLARETYGKNSGEACDEIGPRTVSVARALQDANRADRTTQTPRAALSPSLLRRPTAAGQGQAGSSTSDKQLADTDSDTEQALIAELAVGLNAQPEASSFNRETPVRTQPPLARSRRQLDQVDWSLFEAQNELSAAHPQQQSAPRDALARLSPDKLHRRAGSRTSQTGPSRPKSVTSPAPKVAHVNREPDAIGAAYVRETDRLYAPPARAPLPRAAHALSWLLSAAMITAVVLSGGIIVARGTPSLTPTWVDQLLPRPTATRPPGRSVRLDAPRAPGAATNSMTR